MRALLRLLIAAALLAAPSAVGADEALTRIAFGSCAGQDRPQEFWDVIAAADPQVFLFLGDNVYADTFDPVAMRYVYEALAAKEPFRRFRAAVPILAMWDDHDFGSNDIGGDHPRKWDAQSIFLDFFGVPKDSPRRKRAGVYHSETFGPPGRRVQIILLDTRFHRSPLKVDKKKDRPWPYVPNTDRRATILGRTQWAWLEAQLRAPADVRIIASSIQVVAKDHPFEKWANIPAERAKLMAVIRKTKAEGVVILSGDRHLGELSVLSDGPGYPLYDLTSSSLNKPLELDPKDPHERAILEKNRHRTGPLVLETNFGLVNIDWKRVPPVIGFELRNTSGTVVLSNEVSLDRLKFR